MTGRRDGRAVCVWALATATAMAIGCSPGEKMNSLTPVPALPEPDRSAAPPSDLTLYLFDDKAEQSQEEGARKPTFSLTSPDIQPTGAGVWEFERAVAVVHAPDGDTRIEAARGELNQDTGVAAMRDGVRVDMGDKSLELQDLEWRNTTREARTGNPVTLTSEGARLEAKGMLLKPDENKLVLYDVRGDFSAGKSAQESAEKLAPANTAQALANESARMPARKDPS